MGKNLARKISNLLFIQHRISKAIVRTPYNNTKILIQAVMAGRQNKNIMQKNMNKTDQSIRFSPNDPINPKIVSITHLGV